MLFMLSCSMESSTECQREGGGNENKIKNTEDAFDRESSIKSFHANKSELSTTTETELIDIDDFELSDEESWLYKSPKKQMSEDKPANSEKLRQKNIDDMDDVQLKATRTALLTKLNQLKSLNSSIDVKGAKKDAKERNPEKSAEKKAGNTEETREAIKQEQSQFTSRIEKNVHPNVKEGRKLSSSEQESWKKSEVFDVLDVQKIARIQEESLKQSTYKFLSNSGKKAMSNRDLSPASPAQIANLNKPASVEALNTCTDKMNQSNVYSIVPLHGMKKQNMFNSSSALNCSQEFHRGSLPNIINKGYYSLKSKKAKRPSEPKNSCPLPVYPSRSKVALNGSMSQRSFDSHPKSANPSYERETRTLPSSYRIHSRSNSSSRREGNALSPRRESMPFLRDSSVESNQRDSHRKYSTPISSASVYPRCNMSSSATVSPTKSCNSPPQILRSPPSVEYHRAASHSPSRRLPLATVQHQSPRKGNSLVFSRNGEIKTHKVPSKIPSPASKSGIPVPSAASRADEDDTWNQDCF